MRIAYLSESLPPQWDGVSRTIIQLTRTLEQRGIAFRFFSGADPCPTLPWRDRVHRLPSLPFPLYDAYRFSIPWFQDLDVALDAFRPDLVHTLNPTLLGLYGIQYARRRNLPVVSSYHTRYAAYLPYYRLGAMTRVAWGLMARFYNGCDATFAPSRAAMRELRERGVRRVGLWGRGIDPEQFSPAFRSAGLRRSAGPGEDPILLYVGRLVGEKNLDLLARSVSDLRRAGIGFRAVVVGDGPLRRTLQARMPEAHFTGMLTGAGLSAWYASADIFAFPSTTETLGNVVLEAFASGLPVVALAEGGVTDLVQDGANGFAVSPGRPGAFTDAIARLVRDPGLRGRLSRGALRSSLRYDWTAVNHQLLEHYRRILGGGVLRPLRPGARERLVEVGS